MTPGPLLLAAAGCLVAGIAVGARRPRVWTGLTLAGAAAALAAAVVVLAGAPAWTWRSEFVVGGAALFLRLDGLNALFLVLLSVVGAAGAIYAGEYWADAHYPTSAPRGRRWWSALLLSMVAVLVAANGLQFLFAWEMFTISAYFLVTLDRARADVRAAGWLYLTASHVGTLGLFALFSAVAVHTGSWDLGPMRDQPGLAPWYWAVLVGFGVKGGVFPLHFWLPSAHAKAPSHVSAIMSAVAIMMGVYGIVRFSSWLPVPSAAGWVVLGLGAAGALLGVAFALAQDDYKRLLAYSSVENVGIIMIGLGAALLAASHGDAPWGRLVLAGALLHVWNHGAFKALLFFGAGSVQHASGTREMSRLGGLGRTMPRTALLFGVGVVAVSCLPPLNGFVSEWLVYLGLFEAVAGRGPAAGAAMLAVIALGMAGALALASFVKAGAMIFLGSPRTQAAAKAHESGGRVLGPMAALALLCVALGLAPIAVWPAVACATGAWQPSWAPAAGPGPLYPLGLVHVALAGVIALAGAALWWKFRANGLRRALTWDCGYAAPTSRMQYTSGSFAGIAARWFAWVLRPVLTLRRPRGQFPTAAQCRETIPETMLERVIEPVGDVFLQVSTAVRRLQHGRLQTYILYLVAGLAAMGTLVLMGGRP